MALFKLDWAFPTQESSFAGGEKFLEYLEAGGPADETEGFKILWRVTNHLMEKVASSLKQLISARCGNTLLLG